MKKRILFLALAAVITLASVSGVCSSVVAYADSTEPPTPTPHVHAYTKSEIILNPTESKNGVIRYYCKDVKTCGEYFDEEIAPLPNVYVSKFRGDDKNLCTRITAHQSYKVVDGELSIVMKDHNANLIGHQYNYNWEDNLIKVRSIEFKASDVGVGYFNEKVDTYSLTIPLRAVTDCDENGNVNVYLTTGAAIVRLNEEATSALLKSAKESLGVIVTRNGDEVSAQLVVDEKEVEAPNGVEMLYWVKDAGDAETASDEILKSQDYNNFKLDGDFDLIFVESLSK